MTTALRRRLSALQRLANRPGTPGVGAAATEAIQRITDRLGRAGKPLETIFEPEPGLGPKRRARRKSAAERQKDHRIRVGDLIDLDGHEGTWRRCACGSSTAQVSPGCPGLAVALLVCVGCRRSRKLRREHFETGGRWRQD